MAPGALARSRASLALIQFGTKCALHTRRQSCHVFLAAVEKAWGGQFMRARTSEIVDGAIRHAQALSATDGYDWRTARAALSKILADLEARDPRDPSLERLRQFIAERDEGSAPSRARKRPPRPGR